MKVGGAIVPTCVNLRRARFQVLLTEAITEKATPQFSWYPICSVNTQNPFIILLNVNIILFVCCGTLKHKQYLFWGNSWPRFVILCDYEWSSKSRFFWGFLAISGGNLCPTLCQLDMTSQLLKNQVTTNHGSPVCWSRAMIARYLSSEHMTHSNSYEIIHQSHLWSIFVGFVSKSKKKNFSSATNDLQKELGY